MFPMSVARLLVNTILGYLGFGKRFAFPFIIWGILAILVLILLQGTLFLIIASLVGFCATTLLLRTADRSKERYQNALYGALPRSWHIVLRAVATLLLLSCSTWTSWLTWRNAAHHAPMFAALTLQWMHFHALGAWVSVGLACFVFAVAKFYGLHRLRQLTVNIVGRYVYPVFCAVCTLPRLVLWCIAWALIWLFSSGS